ncbi:disease resistance protein RGA3 [Populus alba x Populus x berolinensis]|nr:disease resistance protein RGA3 [Populus alba x Populus x berolinensis]
MGGLVKTALAKSVHDDEIVKTNFEMKIEACVSDDFGLKQVIQKILKSATGDRCADLDEGGLKKKLEAILNGRKYLLLLDDVWNEDAQKWLLLKPSLSKGAFGSKVIVTTRSQRVAEIMGTVAAYNLSLLGQEHCLSLFYKCAFKERQMELYPDLVGIGKEIVVKCKQVPLAVINMGTQLYGLPATEALPTQFLQGSTNSLRIFIIEECPNIKVIPECFGNLKKLQNLRIIDCPRLSKRCQKGTGEDWPKIAYIPKIEIDDDDIEEETSNQGPVSSDLLQTV